MSEIPVTIFDMSEGGEGAAAQLEVAKEKCTRLLDGWRARQGVEGDDSVRRSYAFLSGDHITVDSLSSAEAVTVRKTPEGVERKYQWGSGGVLTIPDSDALVAPADYDAFARDLFDAINYAWADGTEVE
ncbi:MAG TPA: hypothetical protein VLG92_03465 [Candidatus Saccharimonadia bacterium]|nr:hypothetical protein [Candidatus Saccharimonadia bacterium]